MKKYKFISLLLNVICSVFFLSSVFADESECPFNISSAKLEVASCSEENGIKILKLTPGGLSPYATNFDKLPTFIVVGGDSEEVLKRVGLGAAASPYNSLIELPDPEGIVNVSDAPISAKLKIAEKGWKVLDMKVVEYSGPQGNEGVVFVCSTLRKKIKEGFAFAVQCNNFYENDISELKAILRSVGG